MDLCACADPQDQLTKLSTLVAARLGATPASTTTLAEVKQTQVDDVRPPAADAQPHVHEMPHPPHHAPAKQHSSRLAELRNGHDYGHDADMDAIFGDESSRGPSLLPLAIAASADHPKLAAVQHGHTGAQTSVIVLQRSWTTRVPTRTGATGTRSS
jgi:hypothetical protein